MSATTANLVQLLEQFKKEFASPSADLNRCRTILTQLKIELAKLSLLVPDANANIQDLILAREVLERGAQWSIRTGDINTFERYYAQLKVYYHDFAKRLPESPNMYPIIGLNLLRLLAQKRIAEFHLILETLDPQVLHDNPYIRYPMKLEQSLMEGSYNRVLASRAEAPTPECAIFLEILEGTIRDEIASSMEKAYKSLSLNDAAQLLSIKQIHDLIKFANERNWKVNPSVQRIEFTTTDHTTDSIPAQAVVNQMLRYATELETIV
jgi:26S proteasome regulatory subunit N12